MPKIQYGVKPDIFKYAHLSASGNVHVQTRRRFCGVRHKTATKGVLTTIFQNTSSTSTRDDKEVRILHRNKALLQRIECEADPMTR